MFSPIFIGGTTRSGTTLLGSMLGSAPDVIVTPESVFKRDLLRHLPRNGRIDDLRTTLGFLMDHWRFRIWGIELPDPSPAEADRIKDLQSLMAYVVQQYAGRTEGVMRWVDHSPHNMWIAGSLAALFDGARFVHTVRDGRAVVASIMRRDWGRPSLKSATHSYLRQIGAALAAEQFLGNRVVRVHYEDLIVEPEQTLHALCDRLDLAYPRQMIRCASFPLPSYTAGQHHLVGGKLVHERIQAWRQELTPAQIEYFEYLAGDMLLCLGYEPVYGATARRPGLVTRCEDRLRTLRIPLDWLRHRLRRVKGVRGATKRSQP